MICEFYIISLPSCSLKALLFIIGLTRFRVVPSMLRLENKKPELTNSIKYNNTAFSMINAMLALFNQSSALKIEKGAK